MTDTFQTNNPHAEGLRLTEISPGQPDESHAGYLRLTVPMWENTDEPGETLLESAVWELNREENGAGWWAIQFGFICDAFGNPDERPEQDYGPIEARSLEDVLLEVAIAEAEFLAERNAQNKES